MPWGLPSRWRRSRRMSSGMPRRDNSRRPACLSSKRSTTRSPCAEGRVETRTSTSCPARRKAIRPSWGTRFSAISRRAMTLMRDTSSVANSRRGRSISRNCPSTRMRTDRYCSKVSRCTSEACSRMASLSSALIKRMIGASPCCSSRSAVCGTLSTRLSRSSSSSSPWATCSAALWPSR
ncbi:hypothetical protein D3C73_1195990 [compost metagenome]